MERTRPFALLGAVYAVVGGATSLVGWAFDITRLKDWLGTGITIKANASICITLAGIALLLLITIPRKSTAVRVLCAIAVIISFLTLAEHLTGWDLGIDTLLFQEPAGALATSAPGRMGIPASTSLFMAGTAIFLSTLNRSARKAASLLGILCVAISSLSIIGYSFGASQLYEIPRVTGIAFQTATMIAALGSGIIAALPEFGLGAALSRNDTGGLAYRRVFFPIIVVSLGLGALRLAGERMGLYDAAFGTSARTLAEIWIILGLLWWMSKGISEAEAETRLISRMPAENPYPVLRISSDGDLLYANQAGAELTMGWGEQGEHPVADDIRRWAIEAMGKGTKSVHEFSAAESIFAGTFVPIPGADVVNVYAADITERKRVGAELAENEERLRIATQTGKVGVWDWDIRSNMVSWTPAVYAMHGVELGEFDGHVESFSSLIHPEDRDFVKERVDQALRDDTPYEVEFRVPLADGTTNWLYTNAIVLRDRDALPYRMIGATVDITERKLAELELARAADIVRYSQDAIIGKDLNGIVTSWNRAAERLFGYTAEEIIGKSITVLIPSDRDEEENEILARLRQGEYIDHYETVRKRKDGTLLDISLSISPLADTSGKIIGASNISRDITDRRKTEAAERDREIMRRLVEAQEAERHRIARDLHDHLGQQLTALRLKLESLRARFNGNATLADEMEQIQNYASRIDMDINYLAWELRPTELDHLGLEDALGSFVREWSKTYDIAAEFHTALKIDRRLPPDLETNLYRIVQEGLNNILKHAGASSVSVLIERRGLQIVLIIEDNGAGFDPTLLTGRMPGGGLGLIGMRERTALYGGTLEIESRPGEGTTVFVRIPMEPQLQTEAA